MDTDDTEDMGDQHPIAPLSRLAARAQEALKGTGLELFGFVIIPNSNPNGPHRAQATLVAAEEVPEAPDDETAATLKEIEQATLAAEQEAQAEATRQELLDSLGNDGGIGLDG